MRQSRPHGEADRDLPGDTQETHIVDIQIPTNVVNRFTDEKGKAFADYHVDGARFIRVWYESRETVVNESEFDLMTETHAAALDNWAKGHEVGVRSGLRAALTLAQEKERSLAAALDERMANDDVLRRTADGRRAIEKDYPYRVAARGRLEGAQAVMNAIEAQVRRSSTGKVA